MDNSVTIKWLVIGGIAALAAYAIYKTVKGVEAGASAVGGAIGTASTAVGGAIASPFENLFTDVTGMSPTPTFNVNTGPSIPQCYYRDASGALMYDSNGNIMQGPCAPGDIGTTPYPGG